MTRASLVALTAVAAAVAACDAKVPLPAIGGDTFAVITSRDGQNVAGALNAVDVKTKQMTLAIDTTIDADHAVRVEGGVIYVLNKIKNNLRTYDAKSWKVLTEVKLEDKDHPADVAFAQDALPIKGTTKVMVTLAGNDGAHAVGVVDLARPADGIVQWIAIPSAEADTDGKPEPSSLYECNGLYYTGTGDYDSVSTFAPTGPGRVAVIDPTKPEAIATIALRHENVTQIVPASSDCTKVLAIASGPFGEMPGARSGVQRVDLATRTAGPTLFDGAALAGVPSNTIIVSETLGFMVVNFDLQTTPQGYDILAKSRVVAFDPMTGTILGDASDKAGFIPFVGVTRDGQLWFGTDNIDSVDNTGNLPTAVWVGPADGMKHPYQRLDLGQKPYFLAFPPAGE
jgi:hypothetical protein